MKEPREGEIQPLVQTKEQCDKKVFIVMQNFQLAAALHYTGHAEPALVLRELSEHIWENNCSFHKPPTAQNLLEIIRPRRHK